MTHRSLYTTAGAIIAAVIILWAGIMIGTSNTVRPVEIQPTIPQTAPSLPPSQTTQTPNIPPPSIPAPVHPSIPTAGNIGANVTDMAKKDGYRIIAGFSGSENKNTELFQATKPTWLIGWETGDGGSFIVELMDQNGNPVELVANSVGSAKEVTYIHQPGAYYLRITSTQPYKIICFEKG